MGDEEAAHYLKVEIENVNTSLCPKGIPFFTI
jgi:hypothetical protein